METKVCEKKHKYGVLRAFATIILCFFLFIFSCAAVLLAVVKNFVREDIISNTVSEINIVMVMDEYGFTERIIDNINSEIVETYNIRKTSVEKFLERDAVKTFISEKLSGYIEAFAQGDVSYTLSGRDISRFLERNESAIFRDIGYAPTKEDYQKIEDYLEDSGFLSEISVDSVLSGADVKIELFEWLLSPITLIAIAVLCAVILLGIYSLNKKYIRFAFFGHRGRFDFCGNGLYNFGSFGSLYSFGCRKRDF